MRKTVIGIAIALCTWLAPATVSAAAMPSGVPHIMHATVHYSAAQCEKLFAPFAKYGVAAARNNAGHPCYAIADAYGGPPNAVGGALAASCYGYWTGWDYYNFLGIWVFGDRVNVGMCFNGTVGWRVWGVDCPIATLPGDGYSNQWCGMWQNNTSAPQAGNNYDITFLYNGSPIILGHGWQRDYFTGSGLNYVYDCFETVCGYGYK